MAQQLFAEAARRGQGAFCNPKDLGKLFRAHQHAQWVGLLGGGLPEGSQLLLAATINNTAYAEQQGGSSSTVQEQVAAALQEGGWGVGQAVVSGLHVQLHVQHPGCP